MPARRHRSCYPLDVTRPGAVVVRIVQSASTEEAQRRGEGIACMVKPTPARAGVVFLFFLFFVVAVAAGTGIGLRSPRPSDVRAVQQCWHGPAHQFPQEYNRGWRQ